MADNGAVFRAQLKTWQLKTEKHLENIMRNATVELMSRIIDRNPEDTSDRADGKVMKGDWQFAPGTAPSGDVSRGDSSAAGALSELNSVQAWKPMSKQPFFGVNRTKYGVLLEYGLYPHDGPRVKGGYSTQAQAGFVGISVEEFGDIVDREAAKRG